MTGMRKLRDGWREWLRRTRAMRRAGASGLREMPPMPQRIPLGDYVPDDWIAKYEKKNRGRP